MWSNALNNPSLFNWLCMFARSSWERIEYARNNEHIHLFETTLTQNMVFEFHQFGKEQFWPIRIYESKKERVNGSDLEIVYHTKIGYLTLYCQCKIADKDLKYAAINHKSGNKLQIELLIEHAVNFGGIPIYLFYNYCANTNYNEKLQRLWRIPVQNFGCSIADAYYIYKEFFRPRSPTRPVTLRFEDVHLNGLSYPFVALERFYLPEFIKEYIERHGPYFTPGPYLNWTGENSSDFFTQAVGWDYWEPIKPSSAAIGKIELPINPSNSIIHQQENAVFAPKYRILFHY